MPHPILMPDASPKRLTRPLAIELPGEAGDTYQGVQTFAGRESSYWPDIPGFLAAWNRRKPAPGYVDEKETVGVIVREEPVLFPIHQALWRKREDSYRFDQYTFAGADDSVRMIGSRPQGFSNREFAMADMSTGLLQAAFVVNDLEEAAHRWISTARVGPFFIVPHAKVERVLYRGTPVTIDFSTALAQAGPLQIELIEQHNDSPSAYRDVYAKGQEGFHHLCTFTNSFDADLERHRSEGSPTAVQGAFGDMRFAYVDTRTRLGHMTEIIEDRASIKAFFKMIADAAVDWNGADPIRYV
jgi:hypothetical protein